MILSDYVFWAMALAIVVPGFATGVQAINMARLRKSVQRDVQRLFEQMDLTLAELRDLSASQAGGLEVITGLRSHLERRPREAASPQPQNSTTRSYEIALRLARNGASREDLMSTCGMSRHEAELAVRLHGPRRAN